MKIKFVYIIIFFVSLGFLIGGSKNLLSEQGNLFQKEMEDYLKKAEIIQVEKDKIMGRTALWKITLDNGEVSRKGYFKYIDRSRPKIPPDSFKYEIAAYELSKLLGLEIIPPIVEREIEGIKGSLQIGVKEFITESFRKRSGDVPPDAIKFHRSIEIIRIFENLVYDECNDEDDIFIQKEDWKVWRVDFTEAFFPSPELILNCELTSCSRKLYENLQNISDDLIKTRLFPYLNKEEIKALLERKIIILKKIAKLIKERGNKVVLW